MKKIVWLISTCFLITGFVAAQQADYKVVFDLTSKDTINHQSVIREVNLIKEGNPAARLEIVVYGQGLNLVRKDRTTQADAIKKLLTDSDISIKVCAIAMKRNNLDPDQLLPGVEIVPDGIYEIISKQRQGWGYIKVAR